MGVKTAISTNADPRACARELREGLGAFNPRFVTFFATSKLDPWALGAALREQFGDVPSIGCTTAGELEGGPDAPGSVALMAMDEQTVRSAHVQLVSDVVREEGTREALDKLAAGVGVSAAQLDPDRFLGMVVHDGLSLGEESVMARLAASTNLPFVGGSAGDNLAFTRTFVFDRFEPHSQASALALVEPVRPHAILKTQSFEVLDRTLEVTEVEEATRTVHSFNGRPAAAEFARQIGVSVAELPANLRKYAVGLVTREGEPFVRSVQRAQGDALVFYCQLKRGMRLNVLQALDIVEGTRQDLKRKIDSMGGCNAIIEFQCILRTLELGVSNRAREYARLFSPIPTLAFATYGESYVGHMNQTSTMLLLR